MTFLSERLLIVLAVTIKLVIGNENRPRLVVLHDESFQIYSKHPTQSDLLGQSLLSSLASSFNLELLISDITRANAFSNVDWDSINVAAVVGIADCEVNKKIASMGRRIGVSMLEMNTKPCEDLKANKMPRSVPLFVAMEERKYQCMVPEITDWIYQNKKKEYRIFGKNSTARNHHEEYLACLGNYGNIEKLLSSNDASAKRRTTFSLELERGKRDLNGRELVVATIHRPPLMILTTEGDTIVHAYGFCVTMLDALGEKLNFTYRLVLPYDGNWGNVLSDGSVNGMVGMVYRKEVDFAANGFTITQKRATVIEFTHPFIDEPTTIMIPAPKQEDNLFAFLIPFSWKVWTSLFVTVAVVSFITWIFASKFTFLPLLYPFLDHSRHTLHKYYWSCAFTLLAQSIGHKVRQTSAARVLLGFWWIMTVILIYTYTSNLIASLTVPKMKILIDSLTALANQRKILWTYRAGAAHDVLFGNAKPPGDYHKIGELMREQPELKVSSDPEGISRVLNDDMAFIKEKSFVDFTIEDDFLKTGECRLSAVPQIFFSAFFGWPLQKNSTYVQVFNMEILRMMQNGLFSEWKRRFWPKPNKCTSGRDGATGPKPLQLRNLYGHFLILGLGFFFSILMLMFETFSRSKIFTTRTNSSQ